MQLTALPGSGTTCGTRDRGNLFGREFAVLHSERIRLCPVANLFKSVQSGLAGRREPVCPFMIQRNDPERIYFSMTPQAMRAPEFPDGSVL